MEHIVFETEGLIDLRAFTTFGVNAKPKTDSPIGYFGTGLKYAVSTLVRLGHRVQVFIGTEEHEFYTSPSKFRDKEFNFIRMRKRKGLMKRWSYDPLPFTTEHGKNWKLWMAFRELESNTRDENGTTYLADEHVPICGEPNTTKIVVDSHDMCTLLQTPNHIFLDPDLEQISNVSGIEVYNQPSDYLFYRGLRVLELTKPSIYTYNITRAIQLTEDRTIADVWSAEYDIKQGILNATNRNMISAITQADPEKHYEGSFSFDVGSIGGDDFNKVVRGRYEKRRNLSPRTTIYAEAYFLPPKVIEDIEVMLTRSEWMAIKGEIETSPEIEAIPAFAPLIDALEDLDDG